jgi:hypothetical protein
MNNKSILEYLDWYFTNGFDFSTYLKEEEITLFF